MALKVTWFYRSMSPATQPADPRFPQGITVNMAKPGAKACALSLKYPAPGVGSWVIECDTCGFTGVVTAAGRRDDPKVGKRRLPG